jgi:hypothetical protein
MFIIVPIVFTGIAYSGIIITVKKQERRAINSTSASKTGTQVKILVRNIQLISVSVILREVDRLNQLKPKNIFQYHILNYIELIGNLSSWSPVILWQIVHRTQTNLPNQWCERLSKLASILPYFR